MQFKCGAIIQDEVKELSGGNELNLLILFLQGNKNILPSNFLVVFYEVRGESDWVLSLTSNSLVFFFVCLFCFVLFCCFHRLVQL